MNMHELTKEYGDAYDRRTLEITAHQADGGKLKDYKGFEIDYEYFQSKIQEVIKETFNLTDKQAGYIMGEAYDRFHSSFRDMFWGAYGIAEFVTKFPKD